MSKHPCLHPVYPVPMSFGSGMYCVRIVFVGRNMQMIPEHSRCLCLHGVLERSRTILDLINKPGIPSEFKPYIKDSRSSVERRELNRTDAEFRDVRGEMEVMNLIIATDHTQELYQ